MSSSCADKIKEDRDDGFVWILEQDLDTINLK